MTSDRLMFFPSKGKIFSRLERKSTNDEPKTVVIFGSARGGTTMTARVVSSFGINLGDDLGVNCEDSAFNLEQLGLKASLHSAQITKYMESEIAVRNQRFETWGWKYPNASLYLPDLISSLRNPHLICIFRDCMAATARMTRKTLKEQGDPFDVLDRFYSIQKSNLDLIKSCDSPSLLCSYEKAIAHPRLFVKQVACFLGIQLNKQQLNDSASEITPGKYIDT